MKGTIPEIGQKKREEADEPELGSGEKTSGGSETCISRQIDLAKKCKAGDACEVRSFRLEVDMDRH